MATKKCPRCGEVKDLDTGFYNRSGGGKQSFCIPCLRQATRVEHTCGRCGIKFFRKDRSSSRKLCSDCSPLGMVCARCKQFKTWDHFYRRNTTDGKGSRYCKDGCAKLATTEWNYGLLPGTAEFVLANMGDACMICGVSKPYDTAHPRTLVVDHCHTTGAVRGILCSSCNSGLGYFRDNPEFLRNAIAYLRRSRNRVRA